MEFFNKKVQELQPKMKKIKNDLVTLPKTQPKIYLLMCFSVMFFREIKTAEEYKIDKNKELNFVPGWE